MGANAIWRIGSVVFSEIGGNHDETENIQSSLTTNQANQSLIKTKTNLYYGIDRYKVAVCSHFFSPCFRGVIFSCKPLERCFSISNYRAIFENEGAK